MGFPDLTTGAGLTALNNWLTTRSYITTYAPTQADVTIFKALKSAPDSVKHLHIARWYKHILSFEEEFASLPGDTSIKYDAYGPQRIEVIDKSALVEDATPDNDEDEVDLFGSDGEEEDADAARLRDERLTAYKEKKAAKPKIAAKSIVIMDVKPWDDETDMVALEASVRGIEKEGLVWGLSKLVSVGFGIKKLQINMVVQDDRISIVELQEEIEGFEDFVQSSDVVTMQKL